MAKMSSRGGVGRTLDNHCLASHLLNIGGVLLSLRGLSTEEMKLNDELMQFSVASGEPEMELEVSWGKSLAPLRTPPTFDSGAVWALFRQETDFVINFTSPALGVDPYKRLRVRNTFRTAELTLNLSALEKHRPAFPLEYPRRRTTHYQLSCLPRSGG